MCQLSWYYFFLEHHRMIQGNIYCSKIFLVPTHCGTHIKSGQPWIRNSINILTIYLVMSLAYWVLLWLAFGSFACSDFLHPHLPAENERIPSSDNCTTTVDFTCRDHRPSLALEFDNRLVLPCNAYFPPACQAISVMAENFSCACLVRSVAGWYIYPQTWMPFPKSFVRTFSSQDICRTFFIPDPFIKGSMIFRYAKSPFILLVIYLQQGKHNLPLLAQSLLARICFYSCNLIMLSDTGWCRASSIWMPFTQ